MVRQKEKENQSTPEGDLGVYCPGMMAVKVKGK